MGTLRKVKLQMKLDKDFRKTLIRSARNEILIDIDGDGQPDIALMDTTRDGDIDTYAIDLSGDGEFDLLAVDNDRNGIPDQILFDQDEDGVLETVAEGEEVEQHILAAIQAVAEVIRMGEYAAAVLDERLDALDQEIRAARRQLRKLQ